IAWRMNDLPGVYQSLLPVSYHAVVLWNAEKHIRQQYAVDLKLAEGQWKKLGTPCWALLDATGMSPEDEIEFGVEVSIPLGLTDAPKEECVSELFDELRRQEEASTDPLGMEYVKRRRMLQEIAATKDPAKVQELRLKFGAYVTANPLPPADESPKFVK